MTLRAPALMLVGCLLSTRAAQAADGSADAAQAAARLDEARALMDQGRFAEACPKLEESERLNSTGKALLNLADCYEKNGQTASAHARFEQAADRALAARRADIEKLARSRARELERRLSTLTITVARDRPGLEVRRDGALVPRSSWATAIPIDPGVHRVEATAPGEPPFATTITVGPSHDLAVVTVPDVAAPPASLASRAGELGAGRGGDRVEGGSAVPGLVVGGLGLAGVGVGAFFGVRALSKKAEAGDACPGSGHTCADPTKLDAARSAHDAAAESALVSTIGFGAGVVGLAVGAYLLVASRSIRVSPAMGRDAAGLRVTGDF